MHKNILITGSTDGIGKLAAEKLAQQGHRIYLHGRNKARLDQTIKAIKDATKNENIHGFLADLSDFNAIQTMVMEVQEELDKIDVLINNAGVFHSPEPTNALGIDLRFMVNYLAPVWMTQHLLDLIQNGEGRILNLSSAAQSPVDFDALTGQKNISVNASYAQSKLAITMWSFFLSQQHKNLFVTAVNPGSLLNTRMVQEAYGHHWSPADKGADILVDLALNSTPEQFDGKYFDNDQGSLGAAHMDAYNQAKIDELMDETNRLLERYTS